jgi:hypothetical protein
MFSAEELIVILELVEAEASWYEQEEDDTQEKVLASIQEKIYNS